MQPQLDIELHSLAYKDRQLLKDLRQQVHPGEKILIVGATGSGKTSLLHTLNLTNPHFRGRILFQGKDLLDHKPEELRSSIMEVMQEPWLDDLSVESVLREPFPTLYIAANLTSRGGGNGCCACYPPLPWTDPIFRRGVPIFPEVRNSASP